MRLPRTVCSAAPTKRYGIVAVCAGEGIANLFKELGADTIVTGGQTMNPLNCGYN